jgi:iron transport multicopper oxidase
MGLLAGVVGLACLLFAGAALADGITNSGGDLRTGWYPDESSLTPQLVSGSTFGQLWSAPVDGQVYAQPLYSPTGTQASPTGMLVVATETDNVYGLDPVNGAQQWHENLGTPFNPGTIQCPDIQPSIGTTATPVIDSSTNTVYMTHKPVANGQVGWYMDALDAATGNEKPGWPVALTTGSGFADNAAVTFFPRTQQQRPGLLLMNGVVYAAFGSHCDAEPFQGWVFGVSTSAHRITAKWVDEDDNNGGGIWEGGSGIMSDGSGRILFATGNGGAPSSPAPGSSVPADCGECVMRLQVQSDGTLKPVDFFAPYDATALDESDSDFGSGGVVGLPDQYFGTFAFPHLAVTVGKEGYVYLLNRDNLGGYDQGPGAGDKVLQRIGPRGGVWGRAAVWPGDGGYVYIPTSTGQTGGGLFDVYKYGLNGSGGPSLSLAGGAPDVFGWGSGSPVITSDRTTSGSAVVWEIWSSNRQGNGGQLRAYSPVPVNNKLQLLHAAWPIGNATNYNMPGVGAGRIYVGTRDGTVLGFGSPTPQPLSGSGLSFPRTTKGTTSAPQTLTMTANQPVTVSSLDASDPEFRLQKPPLPARLNAGDTLSVPVTFTPSQTGPVAGQLTATTTDGATVAFSLSGTGQAPAGLLEANPTFVSMGGTEVGNELTGTVTFSNDGAGPLTVSGFDPPSAPFSVSGAPRANDTIGPGESVNVDISFDPHAVAQYTDEITLSTADGQSLTVDLSAAASTPGHLTFSSENVDFGAVPVGTTASQTFTITNDGGTAVTIDKSKPPFGGAFAASPPTSLPEGTTIEPSHSVTETVTFAPTSLGPTTGTWQITGDDGSGLHLIQFTGTGSTVSATGAPPASSSSPAAPPPPPTGHAAVVAPSAPKLTGSVASTRTVSGTYVTYTAMTADVSRFVLQRVTLGRRGAHGCVAATVRNRARPRCTLYVVVASFAHRDHAGVNKLRLGAHVALRKLSPGRYRLCSTLLDTAGAKHTFYSALRIVAPPPLVNSVRWDELLFGLASML